MLCISPNTSLSDCHSEWIKITLSKAVCILHLLNRPKNKEDYKTHLILNGLDFV